MSGQAASVASIMLFETQDLDTLSTFLTVFGILRVSSDFASQHAWDYLESKGPNVAGFGFGVIRSDWKEVSNYFSQCYGVRHRAPEFFLMQRGQIIKSWHQEEILKVDLPSEIKMCSGFNPDEYHSFMSFRQLSLVTEIQPKEPDWHQKWLNRLAQSINKAHLAPSIRESLEQFCSSWQTAFDCLWPQISRDCQAKFFKQARLLQDSWWHSLAHHSKR